MADGIPALVLGPFGALVLASIALGYGARAVYKWVMDLWAEHLRVDHERQQALVAARASNDANMAIMDRAVAQNERLLAAIVRKGGGSDEG